MASPEALCGSQITEPCGDENQIQIERILFFHYRFSIKAENTGMIVWQPGAQDFGVEYL